MQRRRYDFLFIWVSVWTFIAVGNLQHTFELLEKKNIEATSLVVSETEKDVSEMETESEPSTAKEHCNAEAFWKNNIEINFNENFSEVSLNFKNLKPSEIDALFMELQFVPATDNYRDFRGFSFYNFETMQIPSDQDSYSTSVSLEGVEDDIEVVLRATNKLNSRKHSCWSKRLFTIDKNMQKNHPLLLLKISDFTTTGLYGSERGLPGQESNSYRGLIWSKNRSIGKGGSSGGSFGMGKIAYAGISNIRTFLVNSNISTKKPGEDIPNFEMKNIDLKSLSEGKYKNRFIGRADLISHRINNGEVNYGDDGRFGDTVNGTAESIWDDKELMKRLYLDRGNAAGTTVLIPGVFTTTNIADKPSTDYPLIVNDIKNKIIKNFWPALYKKNLTVKIVLKVNNNQEFSHEIIPEESVPNFIDLIKKYENDLMNPKETLEDINEKNVSKATLGDDLDKGFSVNLTVPKTKKSLKTLGPDYEKFAHNTVDHDVAVLIKKVDLADLSDLERELANTYAQFRGPGIIVDYANSDESRTSFVNFDTGDTDIISVGIYGTYKQFDEDALIADRFLKWIEPPHHDEWNPSKDTASKWKQFYDENDLGNHLAANKRYIEHTVLVKNLLNNLFKEKVSYKEDTPEYQKKLLTVNFKGKKGSGGTGGGISSGGKIIPKTTLSYNKKDHLIIGNTSFNIPKEYGKNNRLNIDLRSVLIDALGKNIRFDITKLSNNLEKGDSSTELKIVSINKDKASKANFSWEVKTKSQNIDPTSISLDLRINKKKAGG